MAWGHLYPLTLPALGAEVPVSFFLGAGGLLWFVQGGRGVGGGDRLLRAWPASSSPQTALWDSLSLSHRVLELEPKPAEMPSLGLVMENGQALPAFLLCSTLLVIKMYAVGVITGYTRLRKKVRDMGCV